MSNNLEFENFETNEDFAKLFEESLKEQKIEGTIVSGKVTSIENGIALIDMGLKTEGKLPVKEYEAFSDKGLEKGDDVEVYLDRQESNTGHAVISYEKAVRQKAWINLEENCKDGDTIDGVIFGRVKGGFTVNIGGVVAFLPGSQVDVRPVKDITPLMNITQPFQILKIDKKQGNVVVSRRAILEEERQDEKNEMLAQIKEGIELEGVVKNITDYGAFIDLGSIDGLLHVTDISWSRISHPSEVLNLGDTIKVKVIKFNQDTKRVSLGIKQLEGNPWEGADTKYAKGSRCSGVVTNLTDYGAFVEIEKGIEGLVHVSEISWTKDTTHPSKKLSLGDKVDVMVLDIDIDKHRISLGMKQCEENPWLDFEKEHPVGSVIEGEVKNLVDFGLFVEFADGLDGLVHVSDLSWSDKPEEDLKSYKVNDKVKAKILGIDSDKERISLGVKQLTDDPRNEAFKDLGKNTIVTCIVTDVNKDGIEVSVNDNVKSFIKKSDLAKDRIEQRPDRFAVGDKVDAKIVSVDKTSGKIILSIKSLEVAEQKKAIAEYGSADSGASLGDILGEALSSSKSSKDKKEDDESKK